MQTIGIIPARYASTRLPGKPLLEIAGKSMIQRVYEQASQAKLLSKVIVATDDKRIVKEVVSFGGLVQMTDQSHTSGTDRCAEVAKDFQDIAAVVNIQGDEPFIDPLQIDLLITRLQEKNVQIATLVRKFQTTEALLNPNTAKVVLNERQEAMYFSRSPIPYLRGIPPKLWLDNATYYQHIGIYGYKRATLLEITKLPQGQLERIESLEQLRWLEHHYPISVALTDKISFGVDTMEDLEKARLMAGEGKGKLKK